ncbi:MAG TPA: chemotaxis protein CheA [Tissierellia bacterium]|nr:chemotaxis protein CheA [Tissierellia bacterium]
MDLDINQYLDIFVEESKEHLESMNDILLELEKDTDNKDLLNELFRISHTLKGMAGTMGFTNMANLTHDMEDVLQAIRSDEIKINTKIVDILFECLDSLEFSANYVSENGKEDGNEHLELIGKLKDLLNDDKEQSNGKDGFKGSEKYDEYVISAVKQAKEKGLDSYKIYIRLSEDCMLKSARAFIIFNTIESFSEIIYSYPSVEDIEDEKFDLEFSLVIVTDHKKDEIKEEIERISEIDEVNIGPVEMDLTKKQVNKKEKSKKSIDKNNVNRKSTSNNIAKTNRVGKTVRVDIDRLDTLMNLVSELIIIKTRMEDMSGTTSKEDMNEAIEYLERITTNLHDAVMKVRMVPIERVFNRFPRMVRDLSKELDKEINLEMSGEETEVDRTVIDEIGDPLIHLIRNSIDHGIEHPDERIKLGKDKEGTVKLKAYPDGNNVVIEVEDDGAGIDHEKVKKKAIEKEIITEQDAEILTKEESVELLFKAGFSTSDIVSDVSGRGVGLDVVKSKIESINGSIEVETFQGKGTRFIIRIPLTLAIIQGLLVKLGEEIYAIPLSSISEITILESEKIRKVQGQEIILYRDKTLPIVRLNSLVGIEDKNMDELTVVIVRKGDKQAGLIVDDLIGQQEIVIKPLGKFLSNIKYLAGATILGNGKISLILDVNSLF